MLERFFLKPQTVDRIMGCWLGQNIELYAAALYETGYSARSILRRVPILVQFADSPMPIRFRTLRKQRTSSSRLWTIGCLCTVWVRRRPYSGVSATWLAVRSDIFIV